MTPQELRSLDYELAGLLGDYQEDNWWLSQDGSRYGNEDGGPKPYSTDWKFLGTLIEALTNPLTHGLRFTLYNTSGHNWMCMLDLPPVKNLTQEPKQAVALTIRDLLLQKTELRENLWK